MIADAWRQDLHNYLGATLRELGGKPIVVGGVADHVHLLGSIKPIHAVSDLAREIKKSSSVWGAERYSEFGWQVGYAAFSVGVGDLERMTGYIARQEEHHRIEASDDELRRLLEENGIEFDVRFFE